MLVLSRLHVWNGIVITYLRHNGAYKQIIVLGINLANISRPMNQNGLKRVRQNTHPYFLKAKHLL